MTLKNLLAIKQLQKFESSTAGLRQLLLSAERYLADAQLIKLSNEGRFDMAYKVVLQCANAGLWANGYRTRTSKPGHHQLAIQVLPLTLGIDQMTVNILDSIRRQRNLTDYQGLPVTEGTMQSCIEQFEN